MAILSKVGYEFIGIGEDAGFYSNVSSDNVLPSVASAHALETAIVEAMLKLGDGPVSEPQKASKR